jgi:DNA-binding GntR family transcriptional regulator
LIANRQMVSFSQDQNIYELLRDQIFHLKFVPGQLISPHEISIRCQANLNMVQKACARLETEGIIKRTLRGFQVIQFDAASIEQIFSVRQALETSALRAGMSQNVMLELQLQRTTWESQRVATIDQTDDVSGFVALDNAFHKRLGQWSNNTPLSAAIDKILWMSTLIQRWQYAHFGVQPDLAQHLHVIDDHVGILDALIASNREAAVALLTEHIAREQALSLAIIRNISAA